MDEWPTVHPQITTAGSTGAVKCSRCGRWIKGNIYYATGSNEPECPDCFGGRFPKITFSCANRELAALRAENARLTRELAVYQRAWELDTSDCEHTPCADFFSGAKICHQCCLDRARAEVENPNPSNQKDPE